MEKFTRSSLNAVISLLIITFFLACNSSKEPDLGLIPVKSADKWQYIDKEGKIIINPQFSYAAGFFEGLALVRNTADPQRYGFINDKGTLVINANYVTATSFSEGLACVVQENGSPTYIDPTGQIKFTLKDAQMASLFSEGFAAFTQIDKDGNLIVGFVDKLGAVKIIPQFFSATLFSEGQSSVMNKERKWGFIDSKGQIVINYQFNSAGSFKDGLCIVSDGKNYGYIDKTGKYLINPQFEDAYPFSDGLARVKMNGKYGYIDKSGKILINPQFDQALDFKDGRASVANSGKWGFIDKDGKFIINTQFDYASNFFGKIAFIESANKIGVIDKDGKYLINPQYDAINRDVLLGEVTNKWVETDYFDAALDVSLVQTYADLINATTTSGIVLDKLKNVSHKVNYSTISVDTNLSNKSRVSYSFNGNATIKTVDYYRGGAETINTSVPISYFASTIYLPKPKAKVLFESLKTMVSAKPGLVLNTEQSNDNTAIYESPTQTWRIYMRNETSIELGVWQKAGMQGMGD